MIRHTCHTFCEEPKCADDSLKDIKKEIENGPSAASSRRLPVSAKAEHYAFKRVTSDLVIEQVFSKDNWKSLVRHVNNTNLKIMGNSDVL